MSQIPLASNIAVWVQRARRYSRRLSVSVINQAIGSGANFAVGLYLVRVLAPVDFGIYGIVMAACLLFASFGNALFLTQMVVHLPDKEDGDQPCYAASILVLVILFCFITLVTGVALNVALLNTEMLPELSDIILPSVAAAIGNMLKNYFLRLAYSWKQEHKALAINLMLAIVLIFIFKLQYEFGWKVDAALSLWIFAIANLIATLLGLILFHLPLTTITIRRVKNAFVETSSGGRWALGGATITWLQSQSYMYVTTIFLGPAGVALANAARMLIAPLTFLLPAITQLFLPRLVEMRNIDKDGMFRSGEVYTILLVALGVFYLMIMWFCSSETISLFVGDRYSIEEIRPLVLAWAIVQVFQLARDGASLTMQALKAFRGLTLAISATATVSIIATIGLSLMLETQGAILGVAIGEFLLAVLLWRYIRNERKCYAS